MVVGNLRALGSDDIDVTCQCGREANLDASGWPDSTEIAAVRWRLRCTLNAVAKRLPCGPTGRNTAHQAIGGCKSVAPDE
jgi:hypothetical protein